MRVVVQQEEDLPIFAFPKFLGLFNEMKEIQYCYEPLWYPEFFAFEFMLKFIFECSHVIQMVLSKTAKSAE